MRLLLTFLILTMLYGCSLDHKYKYLKHKVTCDNNTTVEFIIDYKEEHKELKPPGI